MSTRRPHEALDFQLPDRYLRPQPITLQPAQICACLP